jgi:hypothetical protein
MSILILFFKLKDGQVDLLFFSIIFYVYFNLLLVYLSFSFIVEFFFNILISFLSIFNHKFLFVDLATVYITILIEFIVVFFFFSIQVVYPTNVSFSF